MAIPIVAIVVAVAAVVGALAPVVTGEKDSIPEQVSEAILRGQGIDVDFSPDDDDDEDDD